MSGASASEADGGARRALVVGLLLLAACGDGGTVEETPRLTTTSTEAPITATTATTAAAAATTTTTTGPACAAGELAPPTGELTYTAAELDGLAGGDTVATQLAGDGWHLRIDLGGGGTTDELLRTAPTDVARVMSALDLDGDGADEIWVQVGTGAAVVIVGLYDLDGCDVEPILLEGTPAEFAVGGTVLLLQGLACGASDVTHLGATSEDGVTYATLDLTYELQGGELVRVGDETDVKDADDPAMADYSDFAC